MRNVISGDRVAEQFRAAADAVLALAIQPDDEVTDSTGGRLVRVTGEEDPLMTNAPCCDRPGEVMRAVAEKLAAHGFDVLAADPRDDQHLAITNPECARCELAFDDDDSVRWEYRPATSRDTGPAVMTRLVLHLLAADDATSGDLDAGAHPGVTLKGAVGRALVARGLDVRMLVYEDSIFYDVAAEIVVTNPARPDRGQVRLTDDGDITWECSCHQMASGDADNTADGIVSVMTQVIAILPPRA